MVVTVEHHVGRLVGIRQTGKVTVAELQSSFPEFQTIAKRVNGRMVLATDWRGMRLLDRETTEFLLQIMRSDEGVEAQVVLIDESALMGLQIRRLFRDGGGEHRAVFEDPALAERFLMPYLDPMERVALRNFITSYEEAA